VEEEKKQALVVTVARAFDYEENGMEIDSV
jgi:hypothetical protein